MATREIGTATGLKPGTYTLSRSFSHELLVPAVNEEWIPGINTALATPAHTEPPACPIVIGEVPKQIIAI